MEAFIQLALLVVTGLSLLCLAALAIAQLNLLRSATECGWLQCWSELQIGIKSETRNDPHAGPLRIANI